AAGGTPRERASRGQFDVRLEVSQRVDVGGFEFVFQRVLLGRAVKLAQVIDTRILLRGGAGAHEVRNRDGRQQTDDGDYNHDFHQGETRFARCSDLHSNGYFLFRGVNTCSRQVI